MKLNSIKQQTIYPKQNPNFKGKLGNFAVDLIAKHPIGIAALASSSVVAQKIVMSGSEAVIGPVMDVEIGKAITKVTNEKDGRTNQSSKVQAIRTCAQSVGGTITGVTIRTACIALATFGLSKAGGKIGEMIASGAKDGKNLYQKTQQMQAWGKNLGGALAIFVMMFTNFLIDAPLVNKINKSMTNFADKHIFKKENAPTKEVK